MKPIINQNVEYNEENALKYLKEAFNVSSIKILKESKVTIDHIKKNAKEGYLLDILLINMLKQEKK